MDAPLTLAVHGTDAGGDPVVPTVTVCDYLGATDVQSGRGAICIRASF